MLNAQIYGWALNEIDGLDEKFGDLVDSVVEALEDGKVSLNEKVDIGRHCMELGMDIWELVRSLNKEKADALLYVLRHSDRVLEEEES